MEPSTDNERSPVSLKGTCTNCGEMRQGAFCASCGQKEFSGRITIKGTLTEAFQGIFNIERGLWFTIKALCFRPGEAIAEYISGAVKKYYNPFKFLLLAATIGTLTNYLIADEMDSMMLGADVQMEGDGRDFTKIVLGIIFEHYVLFTVSFLPVLSILTWLLFYRTKKNLAESIVFTAYLLGNYTLIYGTIGVVAILVGAGVWGVSAISMIALLVYFSWAARRFFQVTWLASLWRNCVILLFGYLGSIIMAMVAVMVYLQYTGQLQATP